MTIEGVLAAAATNAGRLAYMYANIKVIPNIHHQDYMYSRALMQQTLRPPYSYTYTHMHTYTHILPPDIN